MKITIFNYLHKMLFIVYTPLLSILVKLFPQNPEDNVCMIIRFHCLALVCSDCRHIALTHYFTEKNISVYYYYLADF